MSLLEFGSSLEIGFNRVYKLRLRSAISNGSLTNSALKKMGLNFSHQQAAWRRAVRSGYVQDSVGLPLYLTPHTTKWLFWLQSSHFHPREKANRQKAKGQCHLNRSGPFYQESKSFSTATRETGKGDRIMRKVLDQSGSSTWGRPRCQLIKPSWNPVTKKAAKMASHTFQRSRGYQHLKR